MEKTVEKYTMVPSSGQPLDFQDILNHTLQKYTLLQQILHSKSTKNNKSGNDPGPESANPQARVQ